MAATRQVQKILHAYVKHSGNARVTMDLLSAFTAKFVAKFAAQTPALAVLAGDDRPMLIADALTELEREGVVQVERVDGVIVSAFYADFYGAEIERWYARMADEKTLAFPSEQDLGTSYPTELVRPVEVTESLMQWLTGEDVPPGQILLLRYPNSVREMMITVRILRESVLPLLLARIRDYLRTDRNAGYSETKLRTVFPNREMLVKEMIDTTQTRPDEALKSITSPSDFHFHFWTQLSTIIIKEYAKKNELLDMEHGFCQAAYLLGYYAVSYKSSHKRDQQRDESFKIISDTLRKPPYVHELTQLYTLTDDRGVLITKRLEREQINAWIEEKFKRPSEQRVSELVSFNTPEKRGLIIHSEEYIPLLLRQIKAAAPILRSAMINDMYQIMEAEGDEQWVEDDGAFSQEAERRVRDEFPVLYGLAYFKTLFLVIDGLELPDGTRDSAMALLDMTKQDIKPWITILRLSRYDMYREARMRLPTWMLIPIVRGIVRLLRHMFSSDADRSKRARRQSSSGRAPEAGTSAASREAQRKAFQDQIATMQRSYLTGDQTPDQRLKQLRTQWNPLIDRVAADNLAEDVNSLCRDTLRRMRYGKSLQAPDGRRITELASRIAANNAFDRIRDRKAFETYLKLYMLTVLQRS